MVSSINLDLIGLTGLLLNEFGYELNLLSCFTTFRKLLIACIGLQIAHANMFDFAFLNRLEIICPLKKRFRPDFAEILDRMSKTSVPIASIDIPSGKLERWWYNRLESTNKFTLKIDT